MNELVIGDYKLVSPHAIVSEYSTSAVIDLGKGLVFYFSPGQMYIDAYNGRMQLCKMAGFTPHALKGMSATVYHVTVSSEDGVTIVVR